MIKPLPKIVDLSEIEPNTRRGGDLRAMLTPATVGSTSGFMGVAIINPGDRIGEHYHPYSEEFVYVVCGQLEVDLDGEPHPLRPEQGPDDPHQHAAPLPQRRQRGGADRLPPGPAGPRPALGHVDTEETQQAVTVAAEPAGREQVRS